MNQNFDQLFLQSKEQRNGEKLLLHVCCAPCATYCLTQVLDAFDVTLYFANDNITAPDEWAKRLGEVRKLVDVVNDGKFEVTPKFPLKLVVQNFDSARFFVAARGLEHEKEGGARCTECFRLRLTDARDYAAANGYDAFSTTLTVSPYKNAQLLNRLGEQLQTEGLTWLPCDFKKRNGYLESVRLSRKYGLYRQHYCGCAFSLSQMQEQTN